MPRVEPTANATNMHATRIALFENLPMVRSRISASDLPRDGQNRGNQRRLEPDARLRWGGPIRAQVAACTKSRTAVLGTSTRVDGRMAALLFRAFPRPIGFRFVSTARTSGSAKSRSRPFLQLRISD